MFKLHIFNVTSGGIDLQLLRQRLSVIVRSFPLEELLTYVKSKKFASVAGYTIHFLSIY